MLETDSFNRFVCSALYDELIENVRLANSLQPQPQPPHQPHSPHSPAPAAAGAAGAAGAGGSGGALGPGRSVTDVHAALKASILSRSQSNVGGGMMPPSPKLEAAAADGGGGQHPSQRVSMVPIRLNPSARGTRTPRPVPIVTASLASSISTAATATATHTPASHIA